MSKINQIQNALKELDGGRFQKLCDCYLQEKGHVHINPIGSVFGSDKVRKGTPDSVVKNRCGNLVFIEYTTQQDCLFSKLSSDIEKCLDESRTGISTSELGQIILCHTGRLTPKEEQQLHQKTAQLKVPLEIYGIEGISFDLYRHFPGIAKDFLGITIDTGQILSPDDFILSYGKSKLSTPLDTEFHFRDEEIEQALSHLHAGRLLLISGPPGAGKSRLALETIHQFKARNPDYELFCIRDRGQDIFEDLRVYFSKPGKFLLLVDDANRLGKFEYITHLLLDCSKHQEIKVIATVRDYAIEKVKKASSTLGDIQEISIKPFEKEEIKGLLKNIFLIKNHHWLNRICEIAKGNPRIAIMAAKTAIKENNLYSIRDVSLLYDQYFSSIREDLEALSDTNVLKVAGIISLFRSVDKKNEKLAKMIESAFAIDAAKFWRLAQQLHEHELVDMYEKEVVKVSDQVLATYLFYLCVFKNKEICLETIFEQFFPAQINRIRDSIYPCLNSFDFEQLTKDIRPVVMKLWATYRKEGNNNALDQLIDSFWFLLETEALLYLHEQVASVEPVTVDWDTVHWEVSSNHQGSDSLLSLLTLFSRAKEDSFKMALEILFQYAEKKPKAIPNILHSLLENFGFDHRSCLENYYRQHVFIDFLLEKSKGGDNVYASRLLLAICKKLLHTQFRDTKLDNKSIHTVDYQLSNDKSLLDLRGKIWDQIIIIFDKIELKSSVIELMIYYSNLNRSVNVSAIAEYDSKKLIPFLKSKLDPQVLQHCIIANRFIDFATSKGIAIDTEYLSKRFNSESYEIFKIVSISFSDFDYNLKHSELEKLKRDKISKYSLGFSLQNYMNLINVLLEIISLTECHRRKYQIQTGIELFFVDLAQRNSILYSEVIDYYLSIGEPLKFYNPQILIKNLTGSLGLNNAKALINKYKFSTSNRWNFAFYKLLDASQVSGGYLEDLYTRYENAERTEIPPCFDYLLNFIEHDNQIVVKVTQILVKRASVNSDFGQAFELLFFADTEVNKQIMDLFKGNELILKQAYIANERVGGRGDYDGKTLNRIMNFDPNFLFELVECFYFNYELSFTFLEKRDYSFLWDRVDVENIMVDVFNKIITLSNGDRLFFDSILESFFAAKKKGSISQNIRERQDTFLKTIIENESKNTGMIALIFDLICNFDVERRVSLFAHFLSINQDLKVFKALRLEPNGFSWSGSAVPMIAGRISYLESLLPLCNSIQLLDHRKHIESYIETLQVQLEQEKKNDFIDDF